MTAPTPAPQPTVPTPVATVQPTATGQPVPPTTTGTVAPVSVPPAQDAQPFFTGGDYVTFVVGMIAAVVAYLAYREAAKSAAEAKRSADAAVRAATANEDAVKEQRRANDLATAQDVRARRDRREARIERQLERHAARALADLDAEEAAGRVTVECAVNSCIDVTIRNDSGSTIADVLLVDVHPFDQPAWKWRRNPSAVGGPQARTARLNNEAEHTIPVVFLDEHGNEHRTAGQTYGTHIRFTDVDGTRWEIGDEDGPKKVPVNDWDLTQPATP